MDSFVQSNFTDLQDEKNSTLIRFTMIQRLKNIYDRTTTKKSVKQTANTLFSPESDSKYPKRYKIVWENVPA